MVKEFDVDGDGFIDFKEFIEVNMQGVDTDEEVMENLKDAFDVEISLTFDAIKESKEVV